MSNSMVNFGDVPTIKNVIPVATFTSDTNGSAVDLLAYTGEAAVILQASAGTGNMTLDIKLQHSDASDGTFADISGAAFTRVTTTAGAQKLSINTNEIKQFIRAVVDVGGTTPSYLVGVTLIGIEG